jgi:aerobic carbon-monoxide dehydrogenase small subunit
MSERMNGRRAVSYTVNGRVIETTVAVRTTLLDHLRDDLRLYGTHVGCEHGVCGCCNVTVDGEVVRSCLMLAYQVDGCEIGTIEGIEGPDGTLSPLQQAFCDHHGLQCGYCTPGMIITIDALLRENPAPTDAELIEAISGNLCRCTGYQQIIDAARAAIAVTAQPSAGEGEDR